MDHPRELLNNGFTILRGAFGDTDVRDHVCDLCGSKEPSFDTIATRFVDEDLALGPSRKNFRVTDEGRGMLTCPKLFSLFSEAFETCSWYDASIIGAIPGRGRQPIHRDYSRPVSASGPWKVVAFTPMEDVLPKGGLTVVHPETHLSNENDATRRRQRIRLHAGDVLVFFSSLRHYGASNDTDRVRVLYSQTFEATAPRFEEFM